MSMHDDYLDPDLHLWPAEEPEEYDDAWVYLNNLYGLPKDNRENAKIKRGVYKYTDCGAWVEFKEDGIELGSIVEGSDHGAETIELTWEEVPEKFAPSLQTIEGQCDLIWKWANVVRKDGKTDMELGLDWPLL